MILRTSICQLIWNSILFKAENLNWSVDPDSGNVSIQVELLANNGFSFSTNQPIGKEKKAWSFLCSCQCTQHQEMEAVSTEAWSSLRKYCFISCREAEYYHFNKYQQLINHIITVKIAFAKHRIYDVCMPVCGRLNGKITCHSVKCGRLCCRHLCYCTCEFFKRGFISGWWFLTSCQSPVNEDDHSISCPEKK